MNSSKILSQFIYTQYPSNSKRAAAEMKLWADNADLVANMITSPIESSELELELMANNKLDSFTGEMKDMIRTARDAFRNTVFDVTAEAAIASPDQMLELVTEYLPDYDSLRNVPWSYWTLKNVHDYITNVNSGQLDHDSFHSGVATYIDQQTADNLKYAREEYLEYKEVEQRDIAYMTEVNAKFKKHVEPFALCDDVTENDKRYLWRHRVQAVDFVTGKTEVHINRLFTTPSVGILRTLLQAREVFGGVKRQDVEVLLSFLPEDVKPDLVRRYCAGVDVQDALNYINCEADGFKPIEPSLDVLIRQVAEVNRKPKLAMSAILPVKLTADEEELLSLLELVDADTRTNVLNQVRGYDVRTIIRYINGEQELSEGSLKVLGYELQNLVNRARMFRAKPAEPIIGAKTMQIEYHARTQCASGEFTGTITLAIDGQLAIVDLLAKADSDVLHKHWITLPSKGYDFTVHHTIVWKNGKCAVAVIVLVYKDGGEVDSVTIVHNL